MKTLYLVRHAKSSWDQPGLSDFDRPLNERGKNDAPRMGDRLKEKNILPAVVISSPAKRALSTCKRICKSIGYSKEHIQTDHRLYHADEEQILDVIRRTRDSSDSLMLFGHNPGITDLANSMTREQAWIANIPTCGVVAYRFNINSWREVHPGIGEFLFFDYPKSKD